MKHDTIYCPARIEFLLHCHTRPDGFEHQDASVHAELIPEWLAAGVIERHEPFEVTPFTRPHYRTTPLGKAWVRALCNVPMLRAAFLDEAGRVLA